MIRHIFPSTEVIQKDLSCTTLTIFLNSLISRYNHHSHIFSHGFINTRTGITVPSRIIRQKVCIIKHRTASLIQTIVSSRRTSLIKTVIQITPVIDLLLIITSQTPDTIVFCCISFTKNRNSKTIQEATHHLEIRIITDTLSHISHRLHYITQHMDITILTGNILLDHRLRVNISLIS